ncbi:flagellar hook-length control protein FliK [Paenibacillus sp. FSL K6-2524]|uniref:flagellar hook-length control protein FliK n=1 Tax=Paenibacillus sp. FSL K6-2524 TaxID=2954516 RepID=UPI0030F81611
MSQILSNVSTGTATNGLWYGASGKVESGQATVQAFDQTLLSMMMGNSQSAEGQTSAQALTLASLNSTVDVEGTGTESEGDTINTLLEDLLQQLDKMDEALSENPSLLEVLQGWLQGIQTLIPQNGSTENDQEGVEGSELPLLAQHSETMRFAIQDALVQMLSAADGQQSTAASSLGQAREVIQSLQSVLNSLKSVQTELNPTVGKESNNNNFSVLAAALGKSSEATTGGNNQQAVRDIVGTQTVQSKDTIISVTGVTSQASDSTDSEATSEGESRLHSGNIVTAGELTLRQAGTTPPKTVAAPVPVENFSKEMSGFLVSKMDIVKLQGISEAKISLYPEHLGQVDVKITMRDGQMIAQFVTETALAKESLEQQMGQLRSALQAQGLQVTKLEVTQNSSLSSHMYQDGRQPGNGTGTGQQQGGKRREIQEEDALLISDLSEEWNEWITEVRSKEVNYGSSFVAKA